MEILRICIEEQILIEYYMIKHLKLLKIQNIMNINVNLIRWFINFLIKNSNGSAVTQVDKSVIKIEFMTKLQLAEELHKPIIRKIEKRKIHSSFKDNILGAYFADMQLISKYNKRFQILINIIDIFSKFAGVIPLKDKRCITTINDFQKNLDESGHKPNKI